MVVQTQPSLQERAVHLSTLRDGAIEALASSSERLTNLTDHLVASLSPVFLHVSWPKWAPISFSEFGIIASTLVIFACICVKSLQPKNSRIGFAVVLSIWFWSTCEWARGTTVIVRELGVAGAAPCTAYWLTVVPQLVSSVLLLLIAHAKGFNILAELGAKGRGAWFVAGTAYFFGQFFTVVALASSTPGLVFAVKALEPLSTALLAIPTLGQEFSERLFFGLVVACSGIAIVSLGAFDLDWSSGHVKTQAMFILGTVILANVGFSTRACVIKKMFAQESMPPEEALGRITVTGLLMGLLPLLAFAPLAIHDYNNGMTFASLSTLFPKLKSQLSTWVGVSMCYFVYQCASLMILERLAVESHALLVACKHVFVAVVGSLLLGEQMSRMMVIGITVTVLGVLVYQTNPKPTGTGIVLPMNRESKTYVPRVLPGVSSLLNIIAGGLLVIAMLYICVLGHAGLRSAIDAPLAESSRWTWKVAPPVN